MNYSKVIDQHYKWFLFSILDNFKTIHTAKNNLVFFHYVELAPWGKKKKKNYYNLELLVYYHQEVAY